MRGSESVTTAYDSGAGLCQSAQLRRQAVSWSGQQASIGRAFKESADLPFSFLSCSCCCMRPDFRKLELELVPQVAVAQRKLQGRPSDGFCRDRKLATSTVAVHCKQLQKNTRHQMCNTLAHVSYADEFCALCLSALSVTHAYAWTRAWGTRWIRHTGR